MRITIDRDIIDKYGLTPAEALYMLFLNQLDEKTQEEDIVRRLVGRLYMGTYDDKRFLTVTGADLLSRLILDTQALDARTIPDESLMEIAVAMQKEYPAGMKPKDTPYGPKPSNTAWRGNKSDLVDRLKKFFMKYGDTYTKEQLVDATKRYVESFKDDRRFMRALPYFIMKSERKVDSDGITHIEDVSDLASLLESEDTGTPTDNRGDSWLEETL